MKNAPLNNGHRTFYRINISLKNNAAKQCSKTMQQNNAKSHTEKYGRKIELKSISGWKGNI